MTKKDRKKSKVLAKDNFQKFEEVLVASLAAASIGLPLMAGAANGIYCLVNELETNSPFETIENFGVATSLTIGVGCGAMYGMEKIIENTNNPDVALLTFASLAGALFGGVGGICYGYLAEKTANIISQNIVYVGTEILPTTLKYYSSVINSIPPEGIILAGAAATLIGGTYYLCSTAGETYDEEIAE